MITKQVLFSMLIFATTNILSIENTENEMPRIFQLNTKTLATNPPVPGDTKLFKQNSENRYYFHVTMSDEEFRQLLNDNDGKSCVYCPSIKSMIVDNDNLYNCDALQIALLSNEVRILRKKLLDTKTAIANLHNSI